MRFKKTLIAVALSIGVITPALAFAQTTYIKSLLDTVHSLTVGLNGSLSAGNAANIPASCLSLNNTLTIGSADAKTNGEVTKLQTFLKNQGFFTGSPTGFYGASTKTAVGAWQSSQGLAYPGEDGYGSTGPKTRAAIVIRTCSPRNNGTTKPATTLGVAAVAAVTPNSGKNTYYISPGGNDSAACTATAPCATFKRGYAVMSSGDTLIVKNGKYSNLAFLNSNTKPPSGSASAYTQVVAETDGGVTIDGIGFTSTYQYSPLWFEVTDPNALSYVTIRGFVFRKQPLGALVYAGHHLKFIRNGFEDASDGNASVFNLGALTHDILVEESYAWGSGRYKFSAAGSDSKGNPTNIIFRRLVARFDRANPQHDGRSEPIAGFVFYSVRNAVCQNCISIDGDRPDLWLSPEEYSGSFSIPSTNGLSQGVKISGSIALNVAMQFLTITKNVNDVKVDNSVAWNVQQASLQRDAGTFTNLTLGNIYGPSRNGAQIGLDHWGGGTYNNPMTISNSILYKIAGTAITGFDSVNNNVFFGNTSNGSFSGTGNVTADPGLKYITRTTDAASVAQGKGANIINRIGVSGTLWGESGWDSVTSEPLWPFPYEAVIARDMKSYSSSGLSGDRGFAARYPASQTPLTDYIWGYLGNPVPSEFGGGTTPPPPTTTTYSLTATATVGGTISPSGLVSVQSGGTQTYTITPSTGYSINDVKVNGVSVGKVTTYTFSNVTGNQTIAASFATTVVVTPPSTKFIAGDRVQTTASLNVRGTPSTTGTALGTQATGALGTVVSGPTVANGYNWWNVNYDSGVDGWSIDDYLVKTTTPPPATVYTITATAGTGGSISPSGASSVTAGTSKTYTITPNSGYQIASVIVNGTSVGAVGSYTFNNVIANRTISATFSLSPVVNPTTTPPVVTYTINASAGAGGSISPSGAVSVTSGGSRTFTITPASGYILFDVKVNNVSVGKVTTYTFSNVAANQSISATFSAVTATPVPNSSFTIGTRIQVLSAATVRYGAAITQTVTGTQNTGTLGSITNGPKIVDGYVWWNVNFDGNTLDGWTIQDNLAVAPTTPTVPSVPTTTPPVITYIITALTGTGGSISPSGSANITAGASATYTITPSSGYKIADVLVNGSSVGAVTTYTFTNVTSNKTINASFSQVPQFNCPCSLLNGTPSTAMDPDSGAVELGMKFTPSVNGTITSIRFYKGGTANKGTHIGKIWTTSGQTLGSVTFTSESNTGWQTATFANPISVSANTTYIASYYAPSGRYSASNNYFTSAKTVGPLTTPVNAGVYKYGGGLPTETYQSSNYWVDVSFTPSATVAVAPTQDSGIDAWLVSQLGAVIDALQAALKALR